VVVGPKGEEVWTDQYGRVKVQFPWDEDGKKDEKSSMWIRVAQNSAGKGYGFMFLPRIGNEVVVAYLNGDPDRPLVTGSVYNGDNSTPVTLPANSTQSTIKTLSSKKGVAGNEIRFEDKKDSEELYLHAQKDYKVEIENDMTTTLKAGSEVHTVEKGSRTVSIKAGDEVHSNEKKFSHTVKGDYILKIDGKLSIVVGGAIEIKSDASISLNAGSKFTAEASQSVAIKAGTTLASNAGTSLVNKAGTSLTNQAGTDLINKASLQLSNKAAIINSKADATHTVEAGAMMTVKGAIVQVN
jgi:type VI secretion system secreted protein VgrG